ncbi:MAG TPA: pentapeptide repeat-containing protein [Ktedonobacteraceae bacterium]|nr:pentapeptide repeat-containing protein [Ktedonobacteraceae bacterium]
MGDQRPVLRGTDLRRADLRGADLTGVDLSEAILDGAIFDDAVLNSLEEARKADLLRKQMLSSELLNLLKQEK